MSLNNMHFVLAEINPAHHAQVEQCEETGSHASTGEYLNTILHSNVLNFFIVLVFLVWIIRKTNLFSVIAEKQNIIKENIKKSETLQEQAEKKLTEVKSLVSNTENEIKNIVSEAKQVAESITSQVNEEIQKETQELHKKADKIVLSDSIKVNSEISRDVTKAAFVVAEQHINSAIDERLHRKYIDDFIENLSDLKV